MILYLLNVCKQMIDVKLIPLNCNKQYEINNMQKN